VERKCNRTNAETINQRSYKSQKPSRAQTHTEQGRQKALTGHW